MLCAFSSVHGDEKKAPAKQVPVESLDDFEARPQPNPDSKDAAAGAGVQSAESDYESAPVENVKNSETAADADAISRDGGEVVEKVAEKPSSGPAVAPGSGQKPEQSGASFSDGAESGPGIPRRKPPKPVIRKADSDKKSRKPDAALKRTDRDKYLCKVLQSCRNDFVRCKSKIKHPDQSPEWSAEKEACGAVYKECVHKEFQGGEWFFTRWFYFQELNCT